MLEYEKRDETLKGLGYSSYRAYLRSSLWREIRRQVLTKHKVCAACKSRPSTQVHHKRYTKEILMGESLAGMFGVCGCCHKKIEFTHGRKNTLREANIKFADMDFRSARKIRNIERKKSLGLSLSKKESRGVRRRRLKEQGRPYPHKFTCLLCKEDRFAQVENAQYCSKCKKKRPR